MNVRNTLSLTAANTSLESAELPNTVNTANTIHIAKSPMTKPAAAPAALFICLRTGSFASTEINPNITLSNMNTIKKLMTNVITLNIKSDM